MKSLQMRSRLSSTVSSRAVVLAAVLLSAAAPAAADTFNGTVGLDVLVGTSGEDTLRGDVGNDVLFGDRVSRVTQPNNLVDLGINPKGETMLGSVLTYSYGGAFAPDGRLMLHSWSDLSPRAQNGHWQVHIRDLFNGASDIVQTLPNGEYIMTGSHQGVMSRDGKSILMATYGTEPRIGDANDNWDVVFKDLGKKQTVKLLSATKAGVQGMGHNRLSMFSEFDGRNAIFYSHATNFGVRDNNDTNADVFLKEVKSGKLIHISATRTGAGANCNSHDGSLSPDSTKVLFYSCASNLVPGSSGGQIYIKDLKTLDVTRVSNNTFGVMANSTTHEGQWSPDGKRIVFRSHASNMVAGNGSEFADIFEKNLETDQVTLVSAAADGTAGNDHSITPIYSPDGRMVAFRSRASNLVPDDTNNVTVDGVDIKPYDLFVKDLVTGQIVRVSVGVDGQQLDKDTQYYSFTPDGSAIIFSTLSDKLAPDGVENWETYLVKLPFNAGAADTLDGDAGNDRLYGALGNDTLLGGPGDDILDGGLGADAMNGGSDNDLYFVDNAGDTVTELIGGGKDTVKSLVSFTLDPFVENLILGGTANIDATGNRANNLLMGNAGDNLIKGEAGKDLIEGMAGADDLRGGDGKDTLSYLNSSEGVSVNIAINAVSGGHAQGDQIIEFENILGSQRNDALVGDAKGNTIDGGAGNDTIRGGDGGDILFGGPGNDEIFGEEGADKITGGTGADLIVPGMGAGKVIYRSVADSPAAGPDRIANYDPVNGPVIDLKRVDAIAGTTKNDTFIYIGADAFSNTAGQLRYADEKLMGDVDGDGVEDFVIRFPDVADPIPQGMIKL